MVNEKALKRSFLKVKRHISLLKSENVKLREEIKEIKNSVLSKKEIQNIFRKTIREETSKFVPLNKIDSFISKNQDIVFMLQHFNEVDARSITKKQFKYFKHKVDQLRRDAAELSSIKKHIKKNISLETSVRKLNREIRRLQPKNG